MSQQGINFSDCGHAWCEERGNLGGVLQVCGFWLLRFSDFLFFPFFEGSGVGNWVLMN